MRHASTSRCSSAIAPLEGAPIRSIRIVHSPSGYATVRERELAPLRAAAERLGAVRVETLP